MALSGSSPSVPKSNLGRFETRVVKHRVDDHHQRLDFSNQMVSKSSINDVWNLNWAERLRIAKGSLILNHAISNSNVLTLISVLRKKAKKRELKGSQKNKLVPEQIPALEELLRDVYVICRPKESDYYNRKDLVRIFNVIAKEIYGKSDDIPVVEQFGSFLMDIFSAKSDLDLSVNFSNNAVDFPKEKKIQTLRKFAKKLYALQRKGHVSSVHPILTAKVPILKIVDRGTGIECDISIENRDGIVKSQIVRLISSIDDRFQMLSFLVIKYFAIVLNLFRLSAA
ncbi:hypothetical protein TEA_013748 [Camellia sinensis var. sinensis]|uniref:Poly(A) RNA polymerase mitochondrial-like central palm domain-containing protein n=1 Tax=Camellia sinensis var. sinensis TaxID=542762 RepID=A0A4S4F2F1_CAMSN|nr:hypothetical protein TEA_013748 [Camellia sinensis var. sinensis]